jgi:hypothetical protein
VRDHTLSVRAYRLQHDLHGEKFLYEIGLWTGVRLTLVDVYDDFVERKKCTAIERLPSSEKKELWERALTYRRDGVEDKDYLMELSKALYGFDQYLKQCK